MFEKVGPAFFKEFSQGGGELKGMDGSFYSEQF